MAAPGERIQYLKEQWRRQQRFPSSSAMRGCMAASGAAQQLAFQVRAALSSLIYTRYRFLQPVVRMIGGVYVVRDHKATRTRSRRSGRQPGPTA